MGRTHNGFDAMALEGGEWSGLSSTRRTGTGGSAQNFHSRHCERDLRGV
jgi:hypothetical protein